MRTLFIPPVFLTVYAAILISLTLLVMPGERSEQGVICHSAAMVTELPSPPRPAAGLRNSLDERAEEMIEETAF